MPGRGMLARAGVAACLIAASQAGAGETRGLGAHVHGLGQLDIAVEGAGVSMEFAAPGADLVGFEHAPSTDEQRAAVRAALERLERPLALFALPAAAGCRVAEAEVGLIGGGAEEHDHGHDHGAAETDDHDHDHDHAHGHGDSSQEHAHGDDHDHGHDDADEHAHGDGEHGDRHSEFRARYTLACAEPAALGRVDFPYFAAFPNAEALEVRLVSDRGASAHRVERAAPALVLDGLI